MCDFEATIDQMNEDGDGRFQLGKMHKKQNIIDRISASQGLNCKWTFQLKWSDLRHHRSSR